MRKVKNLRPGFASGICSDKNGKRIIKTHKKEGVDEGFDSHIPYMAVKPYFRVDATSVETRDLQLLVGHGLVQYTSPTEQQLVESLATTVLARYESAPIGKSLIDETYAVNAAIENSLAYGNLLMAVTASEAKMTVKMIRDVFIKLFNIVLDIYKSIKKLNVVATIDILTDVWLEYRYGWRPFIGELNSLHEALTVVRPEGIKSAYGNYKRESALIQQIDLERVIVRHGPFVTTYDVTLSGFEELIAKAGFNYTNSLNSRNDSWFAVLGLDFSSLAMTAWELIPFSFIIDMFFNFGNILQASNHADQVCSFNGYLTHQFFATSEFKCKAIAFNGSYPGLYTRDNSFLSRYHLRNLENTLKAEIEYCETAEFYGVPEISCKKVPLGYTLSPSINGRRMHGNVNLGHNTSTYSYKLYYIKRYCCWDSGELQDWQNDYLVSIFDQIFTVFTEEELKVQWLIADEELARLIAFKDAHGYAEATYLGLYSNPRYWFERSRWYLDTEKRFFRFKFHLKCSQTFRLTDPAILEELHVSMRNAFLQRELKDDFYHHLTLDTELSSGQWTDLSAFAFKLGLFFKKLV